MVVVSRGDRSCRSDSASVRVLKSEKTDLICCVIFVGIKKRCFTGFFCREVAKKEAILWAI